VFLVNAALAAAVINQPVLFIKRNIWQIKHQN
jgi:hypothetical protein